MALNQPSTNQTYGSVHSHSEQTKDQTLMLKKMPGRLELYSKSILSSKKANTFLRNHNEEQLVMPNLNVYLKNYYPNSKKIKRYAKVCHFKEQQTLPPTFPHVLAFNLHLKLMTHKYFPLPVIGLVHIRNTLTAYREIKTTEALSIHTFIGQCKRSDKGIEFDILTKISVNDNTVWESSSTYLYLIKNKDKKAPQDRAKAHQEKSPFRYKQTWHLPENLGRKYALASGDANPIHLHTLTAKTFGFHNAIAHGMWLKARTLAALTPIINSKLAMTITVEFKQPTPLKNAVRMNYQEQIASLGDSTKHEIDFDIRSLDDRKLHMVGSMTFPIKT